MGLKYCHLHLQLLNADGQHDLGTRNLATVTTGLCQICYSFMTAENCVGGHVFAAYKNRCKVTETVVSPSSLVMRSRPR